jgi:hypothetical protein
MAVNSNLSPAEETVANRGEDVLPGAGTKIYQLIAPTSRWRLMIQPFDFNPGCAVMPLVKQAVDPGQRDASLVDV